MEQLIVFHDHSMAIIISILVFLLISIIDIREYKFLNLSFVEEQVVEIVWTIFPVVLLILVVLPRIRLLYLIEEFFFPDLSVKVTGYQWYWRYEYPEFILSFESFLERDLGEFRLLEVDNWVIVPAGSRVRILVTREDVIHSWAIQRIGVKIDAIPGRLNQLNIFSLKIGAYFGQCSEICGSNHRFMPISILVLDFESFLEFIF